MASAVALLVVDVQLGMFGSPVIPPVHNGERLLEKISGSVSRARDAGVPVGFVRHGGEAGQPLEEGNEGWRIHPAVAPLDYEPVIRKRTPDSFHGTTLRRELERRGVEGLILAGIQTTEYCVDTTRRRAFNPGYDGTLVRDAHGTWDREGLCADRIIAHHNEVLAGRFATAVDADGVRMKAAG